MKASECGKERKGEAAEASDGRADGSRFKEYIGFGNSSIKGGFHDPEFSGNGCQSARRKMYTSVGSVL